MQLIHRHYDRFRFFSFLGWCMVWLALIWAIIDPSPPPIPLGSDKVIHFTSFLAISLACVTFCRSAWQLGLATAFCAVAAVLLEVTHYVLPQRTFELADMAANLTGTAAGTLIALLLLRLLQRHLMSEPV
jgi:VanZ family protein